MQQLLTQQHPVTVGPYKHETDCMHPVTSTVVRLSVSILVSNRMWCACPLEPRDGSRKDVQWVIFLGWSPVMKSCLHGFNTVGWSTARASGLLEWNVVVSNNVIDVNQHIYRPLVCRPLVYTPYAQWNMTDHNTLVFNWKVTPKCWPLFASFAVWRH